jgi:hypothetical protein
VLVSCAAYKAVSNGEGGKDNDGGATTTGSAAGGEGGAAGEKGTSGSNPARMLENAQEVRP